MNDTCPRCQSSKLIPNVPIIDQGQFSDGQLKAHVTDRNPEAFILKNRLFAKFVVTICGECGHAELSAPNAKWLYAEWLKSRG